MAATPRSPHFREPSASPRGASYSLIADTFPALLGVAKPVADDHEVDELASKYQSKVLANSKEGRVLEDVYNNDGISPGIFNFLWLMKGTGSANQSVHIPQTVVFLNGTPVAWYFWSRQEKKVLKKKGSNITTDNIIDALTANMGDMPVCATYQHQELFSHDPIADVQQAPRALSQVQYLSVPELTSLLTKGIRHKGVGILQKFVVPADKRCNTVCVNWSPQNCVVQRRTNKYRLLDSTVEVARKLVTWDGPELLSETVPLTGTVVTKRVQVFCRELVEHVFSESSGRFNVYRLAATFRTGADNCLHFLGCTSLRLLDAGEPQGEMAGAISRAQRGQHEPAGPVPTTGVMISTMRLNGSSRPLSARRGSASGMGSAPTSPGRPRTSELQRVGGRLYSKDSLPLVGLQAATAVGFAHSLLDKPGPEEQFMCVVTGRVCNNDEQYEVSYRRLIQHWQSELQQTPTEERLAAEQQVPPAIKRAQPNITIKIYLERRNNPAWLAQTAKICEEGASVINLALGTSPRRISSSQQQGNSCSGQHATRLSGNQIVRLSASQLSQCEDGAAATVSALGPGQCTALLGKHASAEVDGIAAHSSAGMPMDATGSDAASSKVSGMQDLEGIAAAGIGSGPGLQPSAASDCIVKAGKATASAAPLKPAEPAEPEQPEEPLASAEHQQTNDDAGQRCRVTHDQHIAQEQQQQQRKQLPAEAAPAAPADAAGIPGPENSTKAAAPPDITSAPKQQEAEAHQQHSTGTAHDGIKTLRTEAVISQEQQMEPDNQAGYALLPDAAPSHGATCLAMAAGDAAADTLGHSIESAASNASYQHQAAPRQRPSRQTTGAVPLHAGRLSSKPEGRHRRQESKSVTRPADGSPMLLASRVKDVRQVYGVQQRTRAAGGKAV